MPIGSVRISEVEDVDCGKDCEFLVITHVVTVCVESLT